MNANKDSYDHLPDEATVPSKRMNKTTFAFRSGIGANRFPAPATGRTRCKRMLRRSNGKRN